MPQGVAKHSRLLWQAKAQAAHKAIARARSPTGREMSQMLIVFLSPSLAQQPFSIKNRSLWRSEFCVYVEEDLYGGTDTLYHVVSV